jgi:hypothetical protein
MNPFTAYVAAIHVQELLEDAELRRRARLADANRDIPSWRRGLGGIFASAARVADPCIELVRSTGGSTDRPSRAYAA